MSNNFKRDTVKWFQVLLFNNSIQYQSFVCAQLNGFNYRKWLNSTIWPVDEILTATTTPSQRGLESISNEGVLNIPQSSRTEASPPDGFVLYLGYMLKGGGLTTLLRYS